jgi:prevent-host-death family protein
MARTVSATQAKNRFGSIVESVAKCGEEVIVETRGTPTAVIISMSEYADLRALKEKQRRAKILENVRGLRDEVSARNADLTPEQAEELADRFVREVVEDMVREGKIRYGGS